MLIAIAGTWHYLQHEARKRDVGDTLQPIAALLDDNKRIIVSLTKDGLTESESAILDTYLQRIRKDGVPKNSVMKQRIDALVNNNTAIVALLFKYIPRARTALFRSAAGKFVDYAASFRDRWQSVFEIFMAGGSVPAAGPAFPSDMAVAVSAEITAAS